MIKTEVQDTRYDEMSQYQDGTNKSSQLTQVSADVSSSKRIVHQPLNINSTSIDQRSSETHLDVDGFEKIIGSHATNRQNQAQGNRILAQAILNEKKQARASTYLYRCLDTYHRIVIKYDKHKKGYLNRLNATVIEDRGQGSSTVLVKIDKRHYQIRIHKSDIYIPKTDPNFHKIFADLVPSLIPDKNIMPLDT